MVIDGLLQDLLTRWVERVTRAAGWVVTAWLLFTGVALYYTVSTLGVNTDTTDMISPELAFRKTQTAYLKQFPDYLNNMVLVVEGATPEQVDSAAGRLAERLKRENAHFESVYVPGASPYFERNALLFLDLPELEALSDRLAEMQPFLARLDADPSLRGLLTLLGQALDPAHAQAGRDMQSVLGRINAAIEARLDGESKPVSWQSLMRGEDANGIARRFVIAKAKPDYRKLFALESAMQAARAAGRDSGIESSVGLQLRITGGVVVEYEELKSVARGAGVAAALALSMVTITLFVGLGSVRLVCSTLLTLISGLIITAAFAAAAVGTLNLISVAFAVLYIGLGIDFAIHLVMRNQEARSGGASAAAAVKEAVRDIGPSLVICALTTAAGFYAFIPTAYSGVGELGLISGTGMFISLAVSLSLLPALLHLWPAKATRRRGPDKPARQPATAWLAELPVKNATTIRVLVLVITLAAVWVVPRARFDYDPMNLRDPSTESVQTYRDLVEQSPDSPWTLTVIAPDTTTAGNYLPRLIALDEVADAVSLSSFLPQARDEKLALIEDLSLVLSLGDEPPNRDPAPREEQRAAIDATLGAAERYLQTSASSSLASEVQRLRDNLSNAQRALDGVDQPEQERLLKALDQDLAGTLPQSLTQLRTSLGIASTTTPDPLPDDLIRRWRSADGSHRIEVYPRDDLRDPISLERFVSSARTVAPDATGEPVVTWEASRAVIATFQQAFVIALIAIGLVLLIELRSVADTLRVLGPLLFGALATAACVTLLGVSFNFANIIALPLLLGIGVDNGIHMLLRARHGAGARVLETSTARAMVLSALTTVFSFGNLSLSPHAGTASMGLLLTIGVMLMLASTLFIIPALLPRNKET